MKFLYCFAPVVVLFVSWLLLPIPEKEQHGAYNTASKLAYCETRAACLHEIAHAIDQQAGWESRSNEFADALQMYLIVELRKPVIAEMPARILKLTYRTDKTPVSIKYEIYAFLFEWAQGERANIPDSLQKFYDWDLASIFISMIDGNKRLYQFAVIR